LGLGGGGGSKSCPDQKVASGDRHEVMRALGRKPGMPLRWDPIPMAHRWQKVPAF
jgi:hypothetical protein